MQPKGRDFSRRRFSGVLLMALLLMGATAGLAQGQTYYFCVENQTTTTINYYTEWCTPAGFNCSGWVLWKITPGATIVHWGRPGIEAFHVRIHSGGPSGLLLNYKFYGTTEGCQKSSTAVIRYNERGFLRISAK